MTATGLGAEGPIEEAEAAFLERSGLLLLAPLAGAGRVLICARAGRALVGRCGSDPRPVTAMQVGDLARLPFASAVFDVAILDSDARPARGGLRRQGSPAVPPEVRRVLKEHGCCVMLGPSPGRLRRLTRLVFGSGRMSVVPPGGHTSQGGARVVSRAAVLVAGARLRELRMTNAGGGSSVGAAHGPVREAFVLGSPASAGRALLDEIVQAARGAPGSRGDLERVRVVFRKLGKTTIRLEAGGRPLLVRVAFGRHGRTRIERNRAALGAVAALPGLPAALRELVPEEVSAGEVRGYRYVAETLRAGEPRRGEWCVGSVEPQAAQFVMALHEASARVVHVDARWIAGRVVDPMMRLSRRIAEPALRDTLGRLRERVLGCLTGRRLTEVTSHGDLTPGNCLYDAGGRLRGVVDWEMRRSDGLPLIDLLSLVEAPREPAGRWTAFDVLEARINRAPERTGVAALDEYCGRFDLAPDVVRSLFVLWWLEHVIERMDVRRFDAGWWAARVLHPLRRFASSAS